MELFSIIIAGINLGFLHAFDIDHVAAVTAVVSKSSGPRDAAFSGLWWALGHTATLAIVACGSIVFQTILPTSFQAMGEIGVGVMLVLVGVWSVKDFLLREKIHAHKHTHDSVSHIHLHSHRMSVNHDHQHRPLLFLVGIGHGLAGSAAVIAIVPITFLASATWIFVYILSFGLGTIAAMSALAFITGKLFDASKVKAAFPLLRGAAGAFSILLGIIWIGLNLQL